VYGVGHYFLVANFSSIKIRRGNRVMHSDPDDCRYYLDKQREELEKQKTEKP
jgi:hypothetical protein